MIAEPRLGVEVESLAVSAYTIPTDEPEADGTFELKFVRPAAQMVQVAPFWLSGGDAPVDTSKTLTLKGGQVVENLGVEAVATHAGRGVRPAHDQ